MTKKNILTFIIALAVSSAAFSQNDKKKDDVRKVIFGLKAGTNFSWFKADTRNLDKGGLKLGFAYGIMGDYNFQQNYAVSFEFLISKLNGKMKFKDSLTYHRDGNIKKTKGVEYEYSNRYIQVPVSFKFRTKEIGYMKYFAQFGLAPAVRITSKVKINGNGLLWSEDDRTGIKTNEPADELFEPEEFDDDVRFINLPLIIGAGFEYNVSGNTSVYVSVRYENGFTNVLKSKGTTVFSKNIGLSAGVFF